MSPELKQFYREIQGWIDGGETPEWFKPSFALCKNLDRFANYRGFNLLSLDLEMMEQFQRRSLSIAFPFNYGIWSIMGEAEAGKVYKNPARLAWIKEHAK